MNQNASRLPGLMSAYQLYLIDGDSATFIKSIGSRYSLSTLHRLAGSESAIVRRASVLAISHLGSRSSLELIGPLLADSDRRVRMVADDAFKSLWYRAAEPRARARLDYLLTLIESNRMQEGYDVADELVRDYPGCPKPTAGELWSASTSTSSKKRSATARRVFSFRLFITWRTLDWVSAGLSKTLRKLRWRPFAGLLRFSPTSKRFASRSSDWKRCFERRPNQTSKP